MKWVMPEDYPTKGDAKAAVKMEVYGTGTCGLVAGVFLLLADKWHRETEHQSRGVYLHPAYCAIIGLGAPAIPLILADLRDRGGWWFDALFRITGEDLVTCPTTTLNYYNIALNKWLAWGRANGHLPPEATRSSGCGITHKLEGENE